MKLHRKSFYALIGLVVFLLICAYFSNDRKPEEIYTAPTPDVVSGPKPDPVIYCTTDDGYPTPCKG